MDQDFSTPNDTQDYVLENITVPDLSLSVILKHCADIDTAERRGVSEIQPVSIELNLGVFTNNFAADYPVITVIQQQHALRLSCTCKASKRKLCTHQVQVLYCIMEKSNFRIFFDEVQRKEKIRQVAKEYGLENESNPDDFFELEYVNKNLEIRPRMKELLPLNSATTAYLEKELLPVETVLPTLSKEVTRMLVVFSKHKYYDHFIIELYEAHLGKDGNIKNPLKVLNPLDFIWKTDDVEELKFFTGLSKFQNNYNETKSASDLDGLKALVRNPLELNVYYHDHKLSDKISSSSIIKVNLKILDIDLNLFVDLKDNFHEVHGQLMVEDQQYDLKFLQVKFGYFIQIENVLYLIDNPDFIRVVDFFKKHNHKILVHASKFNEFQKTILSKLENKIRITYSYLRPASASQLEETGFEKETERLIYLSDSESYVLITPVMKYGTIEVPVLSKRQLYATDQNGNSFIVERDDEAEIHFTALLIRQHPDFAEQNGHESFYLHKERFLDSEWFLNAFEVWQNHHITILGFNELKNNNLNPNRAKISVNVASGLDWFESSVKLQYGRQNVPLKLIHKAIKNKSKFVQLDDGTLGILPKEWIERLSKYFNSGEIVEEKIRIPKVSYSSVLELYDEEFLDKEVRVKLMEYSSAFSKFEKIEDVQVPADLKATLRDYQKQGLNWLNFLDTYGFGGCLADDMGLGKTIQVIAFILSQREKQKQNTNLIVVPTSLIFNWQSELQKFAPSVKLKTFYGADRIRSTEDFELYEVVLTTYGMLLSDIHFLKEYHFNYIFLDESQAIKNPESQRYKAARMLQSRNKVVLTGTPIENNTFDLYGQLSFACPGLLGNKQHFRDHYSKPIDQFGDSKRAKELQKKINPFVLRRTKRQVAKELPEKTEMVIYCEMGVEQRKVYDFYEKEIRDYLNNAKNDEIQRQSMHVLKSLTMLRQICNSPSLLNDEKLYGDASSKIEVLVEQIETKSSQHKILVFSQFVSMLELIRKQLEERNIPFEYLTGQTTNRGAKVDTFQNDEQVRVFLISLKAGGVGLNLTEADYVYLVDPWWNPAVENQAIDRSYRIGQTKNVVAVRLICPNTVEEKILKLQETKKELANELIRTDTAVLKSFSKKELLDLFS